MAEKIVAHPVNLGKLPINTIYITTNKAICDFFILRNLSTILPPYFYNIFPTQIFFYRVMDNPSKI